MATTESKSHYKLKKREAGAPSTAKPIGRVVVPPGLNPDAGCGVPMSDVDKLFASILSSLDLGDCDTAKQGVLQLQKFMALTSGRESRKRGGWKYASEFILDIVLFADLLRSLQSGTDIMSKAVALNLC